MWKASLVVSPRAAPFTHPSKKLGVDFVLDTPCAHAFQALAYTPPTARRTPFLLRVPCLPILAARPQYQIARVPGHSSRSALHFSNDRSS